MVHSFEEAKQMGIEKAAETLKENLEDKKVLDKQIKIEAEAEYIEVQVTYEVEESIGMEEKIIF